MSDLPTLYREAKMSHKFRLPLEEEAKRGARKMWVVPVEPIPIAECWDRRNCCIHSEPEWEVTDDE